MSTINLKEWKEVAKTAFRMFLYFAVFYLLGYIIVLLLVFLSKFVPGVQSLISIIFTLILVFAFMISVAKVLHEMLGKAGYMPQNKDNINVKPLKIEVKKK